MTTTQTIDTNKAPYPIQDLGALSGTPQEVYDRSLTLVEIFTGLCGLETLALNQAAYGHTDCKTFVAANFGDPEAYLTVEHEISHIFFDSDLDMASTFNEVYISELLQKANVQQGSPEAHGYEQALKGIIHNAWNALEDHRVRSLWAEIYPGGGYYLKQRWNNIAEHCMKDVATQDILAYVARTIATGEDTPEAPEQFRLCKPEIDKAAAMVQKADKKTCLAATRIMLDAISDILLDWAKQNQQPAHNNSMNNESFEQDLLKHTKQVGLSDFKDTDLSSAKKNPQKLDAFAKIVQLTGCTSSSVPEDETGAGDTKYNGLGAHDIDKKPMDGPASYRDKRKSVKASTITGIKKLSKMARLAAEGNEKADDALKDMIKKGTNEMKRKIQAAKSELFKSPPVLEDPDACDKVEYDTAAASAGITAIHVKEGPDLPKPSKGAYRIQAELNRLRMAIRRQLQEEGDDLDIEAFIDAKISKSLEDAKIFTDFTKDRGIELLVLTDCSGSMYGNGIAMVDQAMSDIMEATKNLKVKCHLWGFSDYLYTFSKPMSVKGTGGGGTDLIPALDCAIEWASQSKTKRGIIMLTDGYPTSCRNRKSTGNPREDMKNVIEEARKNDVVLSILCINEAVNEYVQCSCQSGAWVSRINRVANCVGCGSPLQYQNQAKGMYDDYFGKGNYAVVNDKQSIAVELPNCARVLVQNHLKSCG